MCKRFTNTFKIFRFYIRRDRWSTLIWLLSVPFVTGAVALTFEHIYGTEAEREAIKEIILNPAITAMVGPAYGIDHYMTSTMMSHQMLLFTMIAVAIMNIIIVVRHTRKDEETGHLEHLLALPVGPLAPFLALFLYVFCVNGILALVHMISLQSLGIPDIDWMGSFTYGLSLGVIGLFFASLTLLFVQLFTSSRQVTSLSFTVLIVSYALRAIGDVREETLSLLSPLGLALRSEVYVNNYRWPYIVLLVFVLVFLIVSAILYLKRDIDQSFLSFQWKKGRKHRNLTTLFHLIFYLQRGLIIAWAFGLFLLGASYGSMLGDLEYFLENLPVIEKMLPETGESTLTEQFLEMLMSVMAILCVVPLLQMILRLGKEEEEKYLESLLTTGTSRTEIFGCYLLISLLMSFFLLLATVIGLFSASLFVMEEVVSFTIYLQLAISYLPPLWVMMGFAALLIGQFPRRRFLLWIYVAYSFVVIYLGDLLDLPEGMKKVTPFAYAVKFPLEIREIVSSGLLVGFSIGLMLLGIVTFQKRDLQ